MNSFQCREPGLSDNRLCSDTIVSILWSVCIILPSLARRLVASNKLLVYQVSSFWIFLRACTNFQMTRLSICSSDQILRLAASAELLVLASWLRTRSYTCSKEQWETTAVSFLDRFCLRVLCNYPQTTWERAATHPEFLVQAHQQHV